MRIVEPSKDDEDESTDDDDSDMGEVQLFLYVLLAYEDDFRITLFWIANGW